MGSGILPTVFATNRAAAPRHLKACSAMHRRCIGQSQRGHRTAARASWLQCEQRSFVTLRAGVTDRCDDGAHLAVALRSRIDATRSRRHDAALIVCCAARCVDWRCRIGQCVDRCIDRSVLRRRIGRIARRDVDRKTATGEQDQKPLHGSSGIVFSTTISSSYSPSSAPTRRRRSTCSGTKRPSQRTTPPRSQIPSQIE